mgnify:CR=1 FL=1
MRNGASIALAIAVTLTLGACGGGGGGSRPGSGQGGGPITPTTPSANVTVAVTSPAINASIAQGDPYNATVSGTWSATNLGSGAVYLQVSDSANTFTLPAIQAAPTNNAFSYSLPIAANIASGERAGTITVRACKDAVCNSTYAGTSGSVGYRLAINDKVGDWETVQGNSSHNGYVGLTLDATKFAKAWEWKTANNGGSNRDYLGSPATGDNGVYMRLRSTIVRDGFQTTEDSFVAFNESDGSLRWKQPAFPNADTTTRYATNLAYASGKLYFGTVRGTPAVALTALDSRSGGKVFASSSSLVSADGAVPTPFSGNIYMSGGATGGRTYFAFDGMSGQQLWNSASSPELEGTASRLPIAVAADATHFYYYGKAGLHIADKQTSSDIAVLASASTPENGFDTPIVTLGGRNNALAYFYKFSSSSFQYESFIASYNLTSRTLEWTTPLYYNAIPAVANGVIYAARAENNQVSLHALSEATGQVLWTWSAPVSDAQFVVGNVVATRNFVFFSAGGRTLGSGTTWAVDLGTRQATWSFPAAGDKAISANRMLYIAHPGGDIISNDTKLVAIKLQ